MNKYLNLSIKTIFLFLLFLLCFNHNVFATPPAPGGEERDYNLGDVGDLEITMGVGDEYTIKIKQIDAIHKDGAAAANITAKTMNSILVKYRGIIVGIAGVCTLTFVAILLITFIKISSSAGNPQKRAEMMKSLIWVFLGLGGFGSITILLSFGLGLFN